MLFFIIQGQGQRKMSIAKILLYACLHATYVLIVHELFQFMPF